MSTSFGLAATAIIAGLLVVAGQQEPSDRQRVLAAAREVMLAAGNCALITLDADGVPQARAMDPFPPEADLSVWLATNPGTRKVAQMRRDERVTLYYFDREGGGYVTLVGTVRLVSDPAEKARLWKPEWSAFYSAANRGDDYLLIEFRPDRLEIVSLAHGIASDPQAWKPEIVDLR